MLWSCHLYDSNESEVCHVCRSYLNENDRVIMLKGSTVYPKKYAHGFVVLCFVVVMQSFIMNSHEVFIHIHQGCFAGTGAIVRLPQCQWSKPDGYEKISQCITTTKHSKAKTVCIFLRIYCNNGNTDRRCIHMRLFRTIETIEFYTLDKLVYSAIHTYPDLIKRPSYGP